MDMRSALSALALVFAVATGAGACALGGHGCPAALLTGVLVEQAGDLFVQPESGGALERVIWPSGYAVRRDGNRLAITDSSGRAVAHTDDIVRIGGGEPEPGTWQACGLFEVGSPAAD